MGSIWKFGAGVLSAAAALVSILSSTSTIREFVSPKPPAGPEPEARWAGLMPAADTATALGDTMHLAVTVTDARGATLTAVAPAWTTTDEGVATVDQDGTVVARGAGAATIVASVGRVAARARIVVRQEPAAIRLADSVIRIAEGERGPLAAGVVDARGARIRDAVVAWRTSDAAVVAVDSAGAVGFAPGAALLTASYGARQAELPVEVLPVPASVTIVGGDDQRSPAGHALPLPVTAQVVSRSGRPVSGVPVEFRMQDGQGAALPAVDTSDARGTVRTTWTLGDAPGRQHLGIGVDGVSVVPILTADADPLPGRTRVMLVGETLAARAGDSLPRPVVIRVTDSAGTALSDLPVSWRTAEGGRLDPIGSRTDSLGEARARWTLGPKAGRQRAQVQVGNPRTLPVLTAVASAGPGPASALRIRAGDGQAGPVGAALARPIVVLAVDRLGNPVPGARLSATPSSGSLPDSSVRADTVGVVTLRWTLGRTAGTQRMALRVEGANPAVEVTARAVGRTAPRPAPPKAKTGSRSTRRAP